MMNTLTHAMQGEWEKIFSLKNDRADFEQYVKDEHNKAVRILSTLGYSLLEDQVHVGGERFVMSGYKLVLIGFDKEKKKVVIKFSSRPSGRSEIQHEHFVAKTLTELDFAAHSFAAPTEFLYQNTNDYTVRIIEYLEEDTSLLTLPTKEQFFLALRAFDVQAGLHAATYGHVRKIKDIFGLASVSDYLTTAKAYGDFIATSSVGLDSNALVAKALSKLEDSHTTISQYCGFLTHTDFAPHNVRVVNNELYLLDQTSLHFGNKHESWARFINYMYLYNPPLAEYLIQYVRNNKSAEEYQSLRLMQLYKLIYLLAFYVSSEQKTAGDHKKLSEVRFTFWSNILEAVLNDESPSGDLIDTYKTTRDKLRSEEEVKRQQALGQL